MEKNKKHWRRQLDHDADFAAERLVKAGELHPMFVLHTHDDQIILVPASWPDGEAKQRAQQNVRLLSLAYDAVAISSIIEAWVRVLEPRPGESSAEYGARADAVPPSEAEDRKEAVVVTLAYRHDGKRCVMGKMLEIVRDSDGRATGVKPFGDSGDAEDAEIEGTFAELLSDERAPPGVRDLARDMADRIGLKPELMKPMS